MSLLTELRDKYSEGWFDSGEEVFTDLKAVTEWAYGWEGLLNLLDEHYPETLFPTVPDDPGRNPGPRIVALIRLTTILAGRIKELEEAAEKVIRTRRARMGITDDDAILALDRANINAIDALAALLLLPPGSR